MDGTEASMALLVHFLVVLIRLHDKLGGKRNLEQNHT